MTRAKRERPAAMAEWNQDELCHWLRLVDLAEAAAMIEGLAGEVVEARAVAREYHSDLCCFNLFPDLAWLSEELGANAKRLPWLDDEETP